MAETSDLSWDLVCLSETRAADADFLLEGGHRLFCSRGSFTHSGVAVLIHARWADKVIHCCAVSDRITYVDLLLHDRKYRVVSVYVPHAGYPPSAFETCMDSLRSTVLQASKLGYIPLVGGDFNTQANVGWRSARLMAVMRETATAAKESVTAFKEKISISSLSFAEAHEVPRKVEGFCQ